jgi:ubiquinone/menaquinone biosynthesis C-methylase UbiE
MSKLPERFLWAADVLNIKPNHSILEIGCGTGLLAEEICSRPPGGKFVGIDRSAAMIEKATKRNHASIETGKASFLMAEFKDVTLPKSSFHTIAAFSVNFFWQDPQQNLR